MRLARLYGLGQPAQRSVIIDRFTIPSSTAYIGQTTMIGKTVSHYRILGKLGEGGMGVVYRAEDTRLRRFVALKFLSPELTRDPEAKSRFVREARAASALDHPNICNIHEIDETEDGQLFLAMACYEGETLKARIARGPLPLDDSIQIALQLTEGLSRAHQEGVIHRDLKPGNIIQTMDGTPKIVDFGLAKLAGQTKLTKNGSTLGTVAYMSPEQIGNQEVDARSDIWSLGVVIYEMITGRLPFRGEREQAVMRAALEEQPEPPTGLRTGVPLELERIVTKCLEKNPGERYQTAEDLVADLRHYERTEPAPTTPHHPPPPPRDGERLLGLRQIVRRRSLRYGTTVVLVVILVAAGMQLIQTRGPTIESIVVLPLANLTGDPDQEFFVDGMTEALITELSKIGALRVISKTSAMHYKGTDKPLSDIARELNVDAVVEGSVFRDGKQVRITAQLIKAEPEQHLWAENYDRDLEDILALFSDVARIIAGEVQVTVTPKERAHLATVRPVNAEAYELYLKGLYHYEKWSREGFEKAIEYFQKAIQINPDFARAHDGLADSNLWLAFTGDLSPEEARSRAEPFLRRALELDPLLSEAHETLAGTMHYFDWNWRGAEEGYKRAIELDPSLVEAHLEYAILLSDLGRFEEAIAEARRAHQLDPLSEPANRTLGLTYYTARQYELAVAQFQEMAALEPNRPGPNYWLATVFEQTERYDDAIRSRQKGMTLSGAPPEKAEVLSRAYLESGPAGYWRWRLESLNGRYDRYPVSTAKYYAKLGDDDQAFAWLERAYETHSVEMHSVKTNPALDPLRDDPRFQDLLLRMNFPE